MYQSDTGVIIASTSFGDSDKIFRVFTKSDGFVPVLAKGVKKINSRRSFHLDTLNLVKLSLYKKGDFYYVNDSSIINNYPNIRASLVISSWVLYIFEALNFMLVEGDPEPELYENLITTLRKLNTTPTKRTVYKYLELIVKKQGFWDYKDEKIHPYLSKLKTSHVVSDHEQLYIDNFFNNKLEEVTEKKLNSILLIRSLN